jgi:transcriptional regulator with XRE-family HTH domain
MSTRDIPLTHNGFEVNAMYERIRNIREDKDLTQAHMARYLNIHQTTYSDYELGKLNIPIPALIHIADYFGTSVDYLIGRTDELMPYPHSEQQS